MAKELLYQGFKLGRFHLSHNIVYAPLTRCRAIDHIPTPNAATYYSQRATIGGFMLTEATVVSPDGIGYPHTPGIYSKEQIEAWKAVTDGVHGKGGVIFLQLWHCGAISTHEFQPDGRDPPSASAIQPDGELFVPGKGMQRIPTPRALTVEEIAEYVELYRQGASNAIDAGFDGIEAVKKFAQIHGGNAYLIDQFLKDSNNSRTDQYGGSIENRTRFALEVTEAVMKEVGPDRVGIRLSPFGGSNGMKDGHPYALYTYLIEELNKLGIAYVHCVEPREENSVGAASPLATFEHNNSEYNLDVFRKAWKGTFLVAGGYLKDSATRALERDHADAIVFGRWFLANPDLVHRFKIDAPLNKYNRATFYTHDPVIGYIDYPILDQVDEASAK